MINKYKQLNKSLFLQSKKNTHLSAKKTAIKRKQKGKDAIRYILIIQQKRN